MFLIIYRWFFILEVMVMMNFPNGFVNPYGMQMGAMGVSPYGLGQHLGTTAPVASYTAVAKDDTQIKVGAIGTLAIVLSAIAMKGKGLKGLIKSSKNVEKAEAAAAKAVKTEVATASKVESQAAAETIQKTGKAAEERIQANPIATPVSIKTTLALPEHIEKAAATNPVKSAGKTAEQRINENIERNAAKNPQVSSAGNPIVTPVNAQSAQESNGLKRIQANIERNAVKNPQVSSVANPIITPYGVETVVKPKKQPKAAISESDRIKYSTGVAYEAPTAEQAAAIAKNNKEAIEAKAIASQIGNNIPTDVYEKLMKIGR